MKILFYSDVHVKDYGSFPGFNVIDTNGLTKELNNTLQGFYFVRDYIKVNKVDLVINLGDTFNVTDYVTTRCLKVVSMGLSAIKNTCLELSIEHIILVGNHEYLNEQKNLHNCDILNNYCVGSQSHVVDDYFEYTKDKVRLSLFPYTSDINKIYEWLLEGQKNSDLMCTHLNFMGACYENNILSASNISPQSKVPIVGGDIHLPQEIGNVVYCGSLVQGKFAQYRTNLNGILIYDTDTHTYERVFNSYSKHYVKVREENIPLIKEKLKPNNVVLQVVLSGKENIESYNEMLKGYEYFYTFGRKEQNTMMDNKIYTEFRNVDPKLVLDNYIQKNNPDASRTFEEIFN